MDRSLLTTRPADAGAKRRMACYLVIGKGFGDSRQRGRRWRSAGESRGRSECGRSEVVLVREVLRVTAVHPASCGEGCGRAPA
jgi:hypothetical protein